MSGTGGAGGQSPAGHVRRPSVPAEPPAVGFTCLPSGGPAPRRRAARHFVRLRLHGGVMKRARRSFESFAALAKAGAAPGNGKPAARFPAVLGRDNRPGGHRPRGTLGDATAAHPLRQRSPVSRTP